MSPDPATSAPQNDPILTVDGDPGDILPDHFAPPARCWLAVETLPIVRRTVPVADLAPYLDTGPLRAGDTVTLAVEREVPESIVHPSGVRRSPFARARVAEVLPIVDARTWTEDPYVAVVLDVDGKAYHFGPDDADGEQVSGEPIGLPNAKPGHWAVRVEDVEAL